MRISTKLTVFLVLLNASAGLVTAMGVAGDMGVSPDVGGDQEVQAANETAGQVESGGGFGDTLFGVFASIFNLFGTVFNLVFAGPTMLSNLGIPTPLVTFLFAPMYIIVAADLAYILSGRFI